MYGEWKIDGKTPSKIESVDYDNKSKVFTFTCIATRQELNADPRTEIELWENIACDQITNKSMRKTGTKLQVSGGKKIILTDGIDVWIGACEYPTYTEDENSHKIQEYKLRIAIEQTRQQFDLFLPRFDKYTNFEYYFYSDQSPNPLNHPYMGFDVGYIRILTEREVRQVILYGSGLCCPAWTAINGIRQEWNVSCIDMERNTKPYGWEKLTYQLGSPTKQIILNTSDHTGNLDICSNNKGARLQYLRLDYV
jgi:hypothetical protein